MDETARHNPKEGRVDPEAQVVLSESSGTEQKILVGANRRIFVDWEIPGPRSDSLHRRVMQATGGIAASDWPGFVGHYAGCHPERLAKGRMNEF